MSTGRLVIDCRSAGAGNPYPVHHHNAYELILVTAGKILLTVENKRYTAAAPALIFLNCLEEHAVHILEEPYERSYLLLSPAAADRAVQSFTLESLLKNRPASFRHVWDAAGFQAEAAALFEQIGREGGTDDPYAEELAACSLKRLLLMALRHNPRLAPLACPMQAGQKTARTVQQIQAYFDRHYREPIQVSRTAADFFISPGRLTHLFKTHTGYSPKQYIMLRRLACAKELLG